MILFNFFSIIKAVQYFNVILHIRPNYSNSRFVEKTFEDAITPYYKSTDFGVKFNWLCCAIYEKDKGYVRYLLQFESKNFTEAGRKKLNDDVELKKAIFHSQFINYFATTSHDIIVTRKHFPIRKPKPEAYYFLTLGVLHSLYQLYFDASRFREVSIKYYENVIVGNELLSLSNISYNYLLRKASYKLHYRDPIDPVQLSSTIGDVNGISRHLVNTYEYIVPPNGRVVIDRIVIMSTTTTSTTTTTASIISATTTASTTHSTATTRTASAASVSKTTKKSKKTNNFTHTSTFSNPNNSAIHEPLFAKQESLPLIVSLTSIAFGAVCLLVLAYVIYQQKKKKLMYKTANGENLQS